MKRVLVTGASGFIGRQSLSPLLDRGYEVHALYSTKPVESDPRVVWHKADLLDETATARLSAKVKASHLLHFAWYVNPKDYKTSPENKRWVQATLDLLHAFTKNGGTRAVLAGTYMEYDWSMPQSLFSETTSPLKPATFYGLCKDETRLAAESYAAEHSLSLAWGRIFPLYGPYEALPRLVPDVVNSLLNDQPALCSSGEQIRDYSFVGDIAGAFSVLVDTPVTEAINIGSGVPIPLKEIVLTIADMLKRPELVRLGAKPTAADEPARIVADVRRLRDEAGWHSCISLKDGLKTTIEWWKSQKNTK